jgi:hypothetical protein
MSGENKDWLGKGPVNKVIYDYLKSMGMIEWKERLFQNRNK